MNMWTLTHDTTSQDKISKSMPKNEVKEGDMIVLYAPKYEEFPFQVKEKIKRSK